MDECIILVTKWLSQRIITCLYSLCSWIHSNQNKRLVSKLLKWPSIITVDLCIISRTKYSVQICLYRVSVKCLNVFVKNISLLANHRPCSLVFLAVGKVLLMYILAYFGIRLFSKQFVLNYMWKLIFNSLVLTFWYLNNIDASLVSVLIYFSIQVAIFKIRKRRNF